MIRLRQYKASDAKTIVGWCKTEEDFRKWTSDRYDKFPITSEDMNKKYLENNYFDEIKKLKLIGMTGTNGKTTTCYLIYQALNKLNIKCAYIITLCFYLDTKKVLNNTTPNIYEIYNMLLE